MPRGRGTQPRTVTVDIGDMLHFQKLDVYRCSIDFLALVHRLRRTLPKGNAELADQLRRSAQSITQNVAEGAGKASRADKAKYFSIARGSATESAAHLDVMKVEELVDGTAYEAAMQLLERLVAMLTRLIDP